MDAKQVTYLQVGSRHRYAIPRMLHQAGRLEKFITTMNSTAGAGRITKLVPTSYMPPALQRLRRRDIVGVPRQKIEVIDSWAVVSQILKLKYGKSAIKFLHMRDRVWTELVLRVGLGDCETVYGLNAENRGVLEIAKIRGLRTVTDVFIDPLAYRRVFEEKRKLRVSANSFESGYADVERYMTAVLQSTDTVLCPSQAVAEGVASLHRDFGSKVVLCPYGSSLHTPNVRREPVPGRFLWVGGEEWVRKGLHTIASVSKAMAKEHGIQFVIAGLAATPNGLKNSEGLLFLGKLNAEQLKDQFRIAQAFVLPTFAEGMASVVVEAIAMGCPVVTTKECGIDGLVDGFNSRLVAPGDVEALANILDEAYNKRLNLEQLAGNASELAQAFTERAWQARLEAALSGTDRYAT